MIPRETTTRSAANQSIEDLENWGKIPQRERLHRGQKRRGRIPGRVRERKRRERKRDFVKSKKKSK